MKIVVIGGTGLIGSNVVEKLKQKDHEAIAAAPSTGVNTITGEGLAEVVIDLANSPSFEDRASMDFFQTAGKNLTAAEVAAGVKHHVALSVVGMERLQDSGYFRAKLAQESLIESSPIPYTIIHATQFFEFLRAIAQFSTYGDTVRLPPVLFQPMAARKSIFPMECGHGMAECACRAAPVGSGCRRFQSRGHRSRLPCGHSPRFGGHCADRMGPGGRGHPSPPGIWIRASNLTIILNNLLGPPMTLGKLPNGGAK
jgi:hypothetical protein